MITLAVNALTRGLLAKSHGWSHKTRNLPIFREQNSPSPTLSNDRHFYFFFWFIAIVGPSAHVVFPPAKPNPSTFIFWQIFYLIFGSVFGSFQGGNPPGDLEIQTDFQMKIKNEKIYKNLIQGKNQILLVEKSFRRTL